MDLFMFFSPAIGMHFLINDPEQRVRSTIVTSGTLTPIHRFEQELGL